MTQGIAALIGWIGLVAFTAVLVWFVVRRR